MPDPIRTPFQRDRGRLLNSPAFRRMKGKMQVVRPNAGDHLRNRLTHSLEVASLARDLARSLRLNEDLVECLALAHDLGHPPFGHSGEDALDMVLQPFGERFEHNAQSLRVVTAFASPYPGHAGLNLTHEVLEGLRKHEKNLPHLEAELVDIADELAYTAADTEDALRIGLISLPEIQEVPYVAQALAKKNAKNITRPLLIRQIIGFGLTQLFEATLARLKASNAAEKHVKGPLGRTVIFSEALMNDFYAYKAFLREKYYKSPQIVAETDLGQQIITHLFHFYHKNPDLLPKKTYAQKTSFERRIVDYLAGMTDEYAQQQYQKHVLSSVVLP